MDDADVIRCLKILTFLPLEEIEAMAKWEGSQLNKAKEILAFEVTKLIHGEEEAMKAQNAARAIFGGGAHSENMPSTELSDGRLHRRRNLGVGSFGENKAGSLEGRSPQANRSGRHLYR